MFRMRRGISVTIVPLFPFARQTRKQNQATLPSDLLRSCFFLAREAGFSPSADRRATGLTMSALSVGEQNP
jgi:hypothetical protein